MPEGLTKALQPRILVIVASTVPALGLVILGGLLAHQQHPRQPFTLLNFLDLGGVFLNLAISSVSYLQLIISNNAFDDFKRDHHEAAAVISIISYVTLVAVLCASFCAAILVDKSDLQGHALAVTLVFLASLWQSGLTWTITRHKTGDAARALSILAKGWALRFDLPDALAYVFISLFLFYSFAWRIGGEPEALDVLHGFVTGAVSFHLSLSAWTFLLEYRDVLGGVHWNRTSG